MGAGIFLLLSLLTQFGFDRMIRDAGYPGSRMISLPTPCSACSSSSSAIKNATATATTPFRRSLRTLRRPQHLAQEFLLGRCQPASPSAKSQVFSCANANPLRGNQLVEVLRFVEFGMISAATSVLALLRLQADQRSRNHVCQSMPHLLHHHLPVRRRRHTSTRSCTHRRLARSL